MCNTEVALVTCFRISLLPLHIGYVEIELISCLEISMLPILKLSASNTYNLYGDIIISLLFCFKIFMLPMYDMAFSLV